MKIDKVIFTIDDNPHYKGFWSSISKHYKERLNMIPKLFIIGNNVDVDSYDNRYGEIEVIEQLPNIPSIIQALIGKFYFTKTEPNTIWKIGDLDLYPLSKEYFTTNIKDIDDDSYLHLNPHAYGHDWRIKPQGLSGYFHVAKGKVFEEELSFTNKSFEDVCLEIFNSDRWGIKFHSISGSQTNKAASPDWGWFCCEEMYTGELLRNSKKLVELLPKNGYTRIDRSNMVYNVNLIPTGHYIDFHSPRPYENHQSVIEDIVSRVN